MICYETIDHHKYKYRLLDDIVCDFPDLSVAAALPGNWATIFGGVLRIKAGYCWNGPDVVPDTMQFARPSALHDALYQLIAAGELPYKPWKEYADSEMYKALREEGMNKFRAKIRYWGVKLGGRARDKYRHPALLVLLTLFAGCVNYGEVSLGKEVSGRWEGSGPTVDAAVGHMTDSGAFIEVRHTSNLRSGPPFNDDFENTVTRVSVGMRIGK